MYRRRVYPFVEDAASSDRNMSVCTAPACVIVPVHFAHRESFKSLRRRKIHGGRLLVLLHKKQRIGLYVLFQHLY